MSTEERTRVELWSESPAQLWRIVEPDTGLPVYQWLPDDLPGGPPVDAGGFDCFFSALFFSLGVDLIRAEAGLLPGVTAADIEAERSRADRLEGRNGNPPSPAELAEFGLFGAYERRRQRLHSRRSWQVDRALRLVSAL